jgi:hypothetical protein
LCDSKGILFEGIAGGLRNLSRIPASNIMLIGQQKKDLAGFSNATAIPHTGLIYYSDIVQAVPKVKTAESVDSLWIWLLQPIPLLGD